MKIDKNKLEKSQMELTIELSIDEVEPYMKEAATHISTEKKIEGFRPGKAPYEIVKQRVGEMEIMQHAVNHIIGKTFYQAIEQEKIEIVDQPRIDIIKSAPNNPFIYKATVDLLPKIQLCEYKNIKIKPVEEVKIKDEEAEKVIDDLRKMRAQEKLVEREAREGDKLEVNFETFIDKVAVAGGKAEKYPLVIGDKQMIPGFEEQLVGLKKDEEKQFELEFPKKYHNNKLAGQKAKFKVKVLAVYERKLAEIDDKFAESLGLKTVLDLRNQIRTNLTQEKADKAGQAKDLELINALIEKCKFDELPEVLINSETHKMLAELKDNVLRQGLKWEDYLAHLNKKEEELRLDFTADAIKRVKTALAIREIAQKESISVSEDEIKAEIDKTLKSYQLNPMYAENLKQIEDNIYNEKSKRYFANLIVNRKVMDYLRQTMIG